MFLRTRPRHRLLFYRKVVVRGTCLGRRVAESVSMVEDAPTVLEMLHKAHHLWIQ